RVVQLLLGGGDIFRKRRQHDVGEDATALCAVAINAVELLHRQLQGAELGPRTARKSIARNLVAEIEQRLHGPLAMRRGIAYDQGPAVVLQSPGKDLRGASAVPTDEHDQRPGVDGALLRIVEVLYRPARSLHLDDRALIDK